MIVPFPQPATFARPRPERPTFDNVVRYAPRPRPRASAYVRAAQSQRRLGVATFACGCVCVLVGLWLATALQSHIVARAAADLARAAEMRGM